MHLCPGCITIVMGLCTSWIEVIEEKEECTGSIRDTPNILHRWVISIQCPKEKEAQILQGCNGHDLDALDDHQVWRFSNNTIGPRIHSRETTYISYF